jgi:tRNA(Ile)-lysidine synthase
MVVVHVDHLTRPDTGSEARLVAAQARRLGMPFVSVRVEPPGTRLRAGVEGTLRELRYGRLASLGGLLGIGSVVTAHTRDDQIETILLRLLSGSAALGASGMGRESRIATASGTLTVIRPLLDIQRADLLAVLRMSCTPHAEDPSNLDPRYRRNRIRHEVIPMLREIDPGFADALARSVELARLDAEVVDHIARIDFSKHAGPDAGCWLIDRDYLRSVPETVGGRVLRLALDAIVEQDGREITRERIAAVLAAARGRTGAVIELPYGVRAHIERTSVRLDTIASPKRVEGYGSDES